MVQTTKSFTLLAVIAIFLLQSPIPAVAAEQYAVTYSIAELSSPAGMQNVYRRIQRAAKQYCPSYSVIRSHRDVANCVNGVIEDLVRKTNNAQFTQFVAGKLDRPGVEVALWSGSNKSID